MKQESVFAWCDCDVEGEHQIVKYLAAAFDRRISAFTVAELGNLIYEKNSVAELPFCDEGVWKCAPGYEIEADTEADARAKMLIFLIENALIGLAEV